MLIKFNTVANRIVAIDRMNINLEEMNDNHIVDVGSKILPMNIQDVFNKAVNMLLNDEITTDKSRAIAYNCNVILSAIKQFETEKEIEELKQILEELENERNEKY